MSAEQKEINLLVTLDCNYLYQLNVMLTSLLDSEPEGCFRVFLLSRGIEEEKLALTRRVLAGRGELCPITVREDQLEGAIRLVEKALSRVSTGEDPRKTAARITAMLARRGYDYDTAREAISRVMEDIHE